MSDSLTLVLNHQRISAYVGNIVRVEADAIVNAANSSLLGGGGVDGAIHKAGGPEILEDCRRIVSQIGHLPPGQAVATTAGKLRARYVIHTVGPVFTGGYEGEPETLAACYRESLSRAEELQLHSIAFPAISTGVYGYPKEDAAKVAIQTVFDTLGVSSHVQSVDFVCFNRADFEIYNRLLTSYAAAHQIVSAEPQTHNKD
jgi:O-acetyl-ADP-ribose deacetylase (regulator of RNase III)